MLKLHLSLALVLLLGCASHQTVEQPDTPVVVETVEEPQLKSAPKHILGPFIYQILTDKGYMGVEFIADHHVWTVEHMLNPRHKGIDKCVNLGPHPYREGLTIGDDLIYVHQKLWYLSTHGSIELVVTHFDENYIYVAVIEGVIIPGDSGTPVFNEHGEVIGCVSATYPKHPFYQPYKYGIIGRF